MSDQQRPRRERDELTRGILDLILHVPSRWGRKRRRGLCLWNWVHSALTIALIVAVLIQAQRIARLTERCERLIEAVRLIVAQDELQAGQLE